MALKKPHIIVLGNEKGGTGKSTVSLHVIVSLMRLGFQVGTIDVDARQGTLTHALDNRASYVKTKGKDLPVPTHIPLPRSPLTATQSAEQDETNRFLEALTTLSTMDFIVIDTPGSDAFLSRLAHSYGDTLITPLNDSFIDLDMLARVHPETYEIIRPSTYAEMVWDQKKRRLMRDQAKSDWIVLRNRLSSINARNKEMMQDVLARLAQRIGFRLVSGFGERVIFRELFLSGLTLLDLQDAGIDMNLSHVAARQELRDLLYHLNLPIVTERLRA